MVKKMPPVDKMEWPGLNTYTLRGKASPKVLAGLGKSKRRLTDMERLDIARKEALIYIYKFYARQHVKDGLTFDEQSEEQKIDIGELFSFTKDFKFHLSKTAVTLVY